ncbi:uncharacterized protein LOC142345696 isoform X2 [Convolutriloba macropyga]|uniref:uncharacterized protein LOC142345696 isoform X2 n=1 Tax=Convolutriloba macropyga TaxID=536237 RepID=UPI003F51C02F
MQIVTDVQGCVPKPHNLGIFFQDILYQRRLRSISEIIFRNVLLPSPQSGTSPNASSQSVSLSSQSLTIVIKSLLGTVLHNSRELEPKRDFIYHNFQLHDTEFDSLLSTRSFVLEVCCNDLVAFSQTVNIENLIFIGSFIQGGGGVLIDLTEFVGSSVYYLSQLKFKPNSFILVFNDAFYCSPELANQCLKEDNVSCKETITDLRSKLGKVQNNFSIVRKKKQLVRGYILNELQGIFNITEKAHSPLKVGKMGSLINRIPMFGSSNRAHNQPREGNHSVDDKQWYICGLWLPKSEVFDPGYHMAKNGARSIDVSKIDDFEIVTAVCYVAWVLVVMSQVSATVLRYQIDISSPARWFVIDNQIDLRDYRENREYDLVLDRKLRVKDDFRFLHALFCINKNIGQLRYKLNLTSGCFTIHKTLRDLNAVLKFLSNKTKLIAAYERVRTASIPIGRPIFPNATSMDSLSVACDTQGSSGSKLSISPSVLEAARKRSAYELASNFSSPNGSGPLSVAVSKDSSHPVDSLDADLELMFPTSSSTSNSNHASTSVRLNEFKAVQSAGSAGMSQLLANGTRTNYGLNNVKVNGQQLHSYNSSIGDVQLYGRVRTHPDDENTGNFSGAPVFSGSALFQEQEGDEYSSGEENEMMTNGLAMAAIQTRQRLASGNPLRPEAFVPTSDSGFR